MDAELAKVEKRDAEREEEENTNIKKGTNEGKQKIKEGGRKRTGSQLVLSSLSSFPYILPFSPLPVLLSSHFSSLRPSPSLSRSVGGRQ